MRPVECNLRPKKPQVQYRQIGADAVGMRLDNFLVRELKGVPRSHVYRIIRSGEVRVNKSRARAHTRLAQADRVRIPPVRVKPRHDNRPPDHLIERLASCVVAQTDAYLALDKPAGLAVHAGSGVRFGVIEILRAARPDETLELVHRLDRDTSGCLLVSRNRGALTRMQRAMREIDVDKRYLALVAGRWKGGERDVDAPLLRDREIGGERMSVVDASGKRALSRFVPLRYFADATLMEVRIATGRTHQIRVHAAHLGFPVAGDRKYGSKSANRHLRSDGLKRMFLHAWKLSLPAIDGHNPVQFEAPLPEQLTRFMARRKETG